jgi:hypothetical protein
MTAHVHPHRTPSRPVAEHARHPLDHSPGVLLALAAVIVVVAGPLTQALAPRTPLVGGAAALTLLVGVVLAVTAAVRLLREPA